MKSFMFQQTPLDLYQGAILRSLPNELLTVQLEILKKLNNLNSEKFNIECQTIPRCNN